MEFAFIVIAVCLVVGGLAALSSGHQNIVENGELRIPAQSGPLASLGKKQTLFSLRNTLIIFGPKANHPTCRLQRKLLKPTIPMLIRDDIAVVEVYGNTPPRRNGDILPWLDASLLRHAFKAEDGFTILFVDQTGKAVFQKQSPMLSEMIAERTGLDLIAPPPRATSDIARRLQAA